MSIDNFPNHLCFTFYKKKMIPQSARRFNETLVKEDKLNDRYSNQLNKINWDILITSENFIKLIYVWDNKTRVLLIDWEENLWEILNVLVKQYGVSIQEKE